MKKIVYAILATLSGLVLIFSYRTSLDVVTPTATDPASSTTTGSTAGSGSSTSGSGASGTASSGTTSSSAASGSTSSGSTSSSGTAPAASSSSGLTDGTYTGASTNTRYGPVQVQVTVTSGQIADVQVIDYPSSNGRDKQINQSAIPRLVSETVQAQSAHIDMVSGATYTSHGYITSLQSAIDQAHS